MVQLRLLSLAVLIVVPALVLGTGSYVFTSSLYERKLARIAEERAAYLALANSAMDMSDKAFVFTEKYQGTLAVCMARLYAPAVQEARLPVKSKKSKGGVGGPDMLRGQNRLP